MRLLLVRHAIAGDRKAWAARGLADAGRPVTDEGRKKMRAAAAGLAEAVSGLDVLAASPLVRARQTADILSGEFPRARREVLTDLSPAGRVDRLAAWLGRQGPRAAVAWVGHEPALSRAASWLLGGLEVPLFELKKGGACLLEFSRAPAPGAGRLLWLLKASQLRRLGR